MKESDRRPSWLQIKAPTEPPRRHERPIHASRFHCRRCGYSSTHRIKHCPVCGIRIRH